jgi:hypothetical protein
VFRLSLLLVAIMLTGGSVPASAQSGGCEKYCREKRCATVVPSGMNYCMQQCVPNCRMINEKKKGK